MKHSRPLLEVCVETLDGALAARNGGAGRIELCSALSEGGLTPGAGLLELAVERSGLPVMVMVRPRGGDFCYTPLELETMRCDIAAAKRAGASGVVLGVLRPEGDVDLERTTELVALARPLAVTFHRAFDLVRDPLASLETLVGLGIERVLTSGQERTAIEGAALIAELVRRAAGRIELMAGAGVTAGNVRELVARTGVREVHASCRSRQASPLRGPAARVALGSGSPEADRERWGTDVDKVRAVAAALAGGSGDRR
jgi:copper homeostasis protein